jgi:peptide deformylase
MTVLQIQKLGNPILRQKAKRVNHISQSILNLIDDMIETMHHANGAGLAAPQIGKPYRIIVVGMPDEEPFVLINPDYVKTSGPYEVEEGCLSYPGHKGKIKRFTSVTVKGRDRKGKEIRIKANDLLAQILQHEIDHLNGTLYIDRVESDDAVYEVDPPDTD